MKTSHKNFTGIVLLSLGILMIVGCAPQPKDVSQEITEANNRFMVAFNSGDAGLMADSYTETGKLLPPNSDEITGKEAIRNFWQGVMDMGISKASLVTVEAISYGNTAIEEGKYALYVGNDIEVDQGKYMVIWQKELGQWKLHSDIWNSSNPPVTARAEANDTVMVVWNNIRADKVAQFEEFNFKILGPAAAEYFPDMVRTTRTLRPVKANEDGTFTYFYLMDPAKNLRGYDMLLPLSAKYGNEQALEYMTMFTDCLKDGKQKWVVTLQTEW